MRWASLQETGGGKNQESNGFDGCRKKLRVATPADAAPLQNAEPDDDGHRDDFYFRWSVEDGKEVPAVFADDDGNGRSGATGGKPVAPADDKAGILPHGATRKIVLPAAAGDRRSEFGHSRGAEKGI